MKTMVLLLCLLVTADVAPTLAVENPIREYALYGHGTLELNVPASWLERVHRPPEELPPTIELTPDRNQPILLMITPLWNMTGDPAVVSIETVYRLVDQDRRGLQERSAEKELVMEPLEGSHAKGYYFKATDKAPKPGEHKYLIRAGLLVGNLLVSATILSHSKESAWVNQAMSVLRSARQREP